MRKYKVHHPLDSPERTLFHKKVIQKKTMLRRLYLKWYTLFSDELRRLPDGMAVELGSGGGFLKNIEPSVICSDIIDLPGNDMTFSALEMPFDANSLSGIFMIDTFHHIPDSEKFLQEARRVLKPGGKMVMIEPANTHWGRFIYKTFHHEPFDTRGSWSIPSAGPLSGANGALPWIVFIRDKEKFSESFSEFNLESIHFINPLTYLISGGVSRKQFLPDLMIPVIDWLDIQLPRISKHLSMFMVITIRKDVIL